MTEYELKEKVVFERREISLTNPACYVRVSKRHYILLNVIAQECNLPIGEVVHRMLDAVLKETEVK